jgi:histidinol-phosphate/aromatic aminotransferase/cobyric acid decarboxylase-like protein
VTALHDPAYYAARYAATHRYRAALARDLEALGIAVVPGCANFLLCHFPAHGPSAAAIIRACQAQGLFLRDVRSMGLKLGDRAIRIAVKDEVTNRKIVEILTSVIARDSTLEDAQTFARPGAAW